MTSSGLRLYKHLVIDGIVITEDTSTDMYVQRFRTKHSLLIFGVQETLYYLNVASRNRMPHFRRHGLRLIIKVRAYYHVEN